MTAEASDMSQGNLFHDCRSKENLLFSIHRDYVQKSFIPILDEAEPLADPKERIVLFLSKSEARRIQILRSQLFGDLTDGRIFLFARFSGEEGKGGHP